MESQEINRLIERYDAGETSLAEERALKEYFAVHPVPRHLEPYKMIFMYASQAREEISQQTTTIGSQKKIYVWTSIAAAVGMAIGLFFYQNINVTSSSAELSQIQDEEQAMQAAEALKMVSEIMQDGRQDLIYLKEFNRTKNRFINTE